MSDDRLDSFESRIRRQAIVFDIGGFRPPDDLRSSWFGRVFWGAEGESWPAHLGKPLLPLAQINLTTLPFRPPRLHDVAFIAVFISPEKLPNHEPNGSNWCLRAYKDLSVLVPLIAPRIESRVREFPMKPRAISADYPIHDDLEEEMPEGYYDQYENVPGLKLGGWPTLIQSEIFWAPWNRHPISPEYVFQIDSNEKANWHWGDGGVGYFGRGTVEGHQDEWALEWQCH